MKYIDTGSAVVGRLQLYVEYAKSMEPSQFFRVRRKYCGHTSYVVIHRRDIYQQRKYVMNQQMLHEIDGLGMNMDRCPILNSIDKKLSQQVIKMQLSFTHRIHVFAFIYQMLVKYLQITNL